MINSDSPPPVQTLSPPPPPPPAPPPPRPPPPPQPHPPQSPHSGHGNPHTPHLVSRYCHADGPPLSTRIGSGISSRDEPTTRLVPLHSGDPDGQDASGVGMMVNLSLDLDYGTHPLRTSLCICLPCLDGHVLSAISRRCCCDMLCRYIVIE